MITSYIGPNSQQQQQQPHSNKLNQSKADIMMDMNDKSVLYIHPSDEDVHLQRNATGDEIYVFDPFNPLNVEITAVEIQTILKRYGLNIPIFNETLYKRAFIHRSYIRRTQSANDTNKIIIASKPISCLPLKTKSNETLEFVGDGVLDCITKFYLYKRFPKQNEGFMTEKKIALVKNEAIGKLASEMGLHKWYIMSKHSETKQTRTNLKKLGCLFEAFLGAIFLDFNKISVNDEHNWFSNVFVTGPGFQAAQIFVEAVFEKHVDWVKLIMNDDNYKNILQVKIQKEFKVTPYYLETPSTQSYSSSSSYSNNNNNNSNNNDVIADRVYHMGVYLCLGQSIHNLRDCDAKLFSEYGSFASIQKAYSSSGHVFVRLGQGNNKIKKKAEQLACEDALSTIDE